MKKYEVMYIIRPSVNEEGREAIIAELNEVFTSNESAVTEVKKWELRELAYEIDGETKGYYVVLNVEANAAALKEFERVANIKEAVIRHIVVAC